MIKSPLRGGALALLLAAGGWTAAGAQTPSATDTVHTDSQGRHLAPHDTFYTLQYVSVTTDKGVDGFPPGTEVHLVSVNKEAHTLTVTDGHANIDLSPDKLTHDMDIAGYVRAKDQAHQAQVLAYQQAEAKVYQEYQKSVADYTAKDLQKREQEIKDTQIRAQEQANASATAQATPAASTNNGYYGEGGYGYGSPYGYFTNDYAPQVNAAKPNTSGTEARSSTNAVGTAPGRGNLPSSQAGGKRP